MISYKTDKEKDQSILWHTHTIEDITAHFHTSLTQGLSTAEAQERRQYGETNELQEKRYSLWLKILYRQVFEMMNWLFIAVAVVCFVFDDAPTGALLVALTLFNMGVTFDDEYKAEKAFMTLREIASHQATVLRDGQDKLIPSNQVVVGDILLLREGNAVAADARLFQLAGLEVNEALLTGEAMPVQKKLTELANSGMSPEKMLCAYTSSP